ncbi:aminotransferase [Bifidobacterium leontopitheci]|uniref:Aminotransferase n=2 Tax=Bifidobacterium leontopitheci TaxID=2650774 RepID=A0A6I1GGB0_9BIFI|nr:aminotransferase [Bifidobacterium leontopitheci]
MSGDDQITANETGVTNDDVTSPTTTSPQPRMSRRALEIQPFRAMVFGERADEMIAGGISVIKLSLGEPDFGAPPAVRDAMREQYDGRALPYTAALGLPELRRAIADFYRERHQVDIDPHRIVITAGGSAALLLATALTVDPGDEVIVADPSYPCNRELIRSFEGKVVDVPTSAATRFHLNRELVAGAWSVRTKAVMVTSPSNPTGTTIDFDVLRGVCDYAREHGAWRIIDETYLDLADREPDGSEVKTALLADPDAIICNSFSKFFGMTGWRLGWAVVPEYTIYAVDDLATNYYLCAHTPTQHAALACFTDESLDVCEQRRQELLARRRIVIDGLKRIGLPLEVEPNGAFYAYFSVAGTGLDAWTFCERALEEAHVALTPGRDFGPATADTHVRLSYAASREALAEGLRRLGGFVASLR